MKGSDLMDDENVTPDPRQSRTLAEQVIGTIVRDLGFDEAVVAEKVDEAWATFMASPDHGKSDLSDPDTLRIVMESATRQLYPDSEGP